MGLYSQLFKLSVRNIGRRGKRTWLTMIGIIIGVTAIISLIALGQGLEQAIVQEFETLGANYVYVSPDGAELTDNDLEVVERARGVDQAIGSYRTNDLVSFRESSEFLTIVGVPGGKFDAYIESQGLSVEENGRGLRSTDKNNVIAGQGLKSGTFERQVAIRSQLTLDNQDLRVVGFLGNSGDPNFEDSIVMELDRVREIYNANQTLSQVSASLQPGFEIENVQENIEQELRNDRGVEEGDEDFSTSTPADILDALTNILSVVQGIVVGIASIALLVGGIGIMNTVYMSITERTKEIGVMKAIGAKKRHISMLFLFEAGIIGLIGSIIGTVIGLGISNLAIYFLQNYTSFSAAQVFSPELIAGALGFGFIIGIISGILPARKAANMDPAESLRYE